MKTLKFFVLIPFIIGSLSGFANNEIVKAKIKVMVIDTGISPHPKLTQYVKYDASHDYSDNHGHGTHIAGIVAYGNQNLSDPLCDSVEIYSCKYYDPRAMKSNNLKTTIKCLQKAIDLKMNYINYSSGGDDKSFEEFSLYKTFTELGGTVVVAAGNEKSDLTDKPYYPAFYLEGYEIVKWNPDLNKSEKLKFKGLQNFIVVQGECKDGKLCSTSNKYPLAARSAGENIYSTAPGGTYTHMTGTSQATADVLHFILRQRCKDLKNGVRLLEE